MEVNIELITRTLKKNNVPIDKVKEVYGAYLLADRIHKDQKRESGEFYIMHPLNVAWNVIQMGVYDPDTISAALLHDTIEDAKFNFTKEDIAAEINPTVAELVDGVTKMKAMDFSNKEEETNANTRKIINGLNKDVRIIIIKLADRLHNMRTLAHKRPEKQRKNALETLELFVPLAKTIGAHSVKNELEELSFKYVYPEITEEITKRREELQKRDSPYLEEMASIINEELRKQGIKGRIVLRAQSIATVFHKIKDHKKIENQYDLNYLKIVVEDYYDTYKVLGIVNKLFTPINGRIRDYIGNPQTDGYQTLHSTVSYKDRFWKVKIRTEEMDKIDAFGVAAYWSIENYDNVSSKVEYGKTVEETNALYRKRFQAAKELKEIDESFPINADYVRESKNNMLAEKVYVYKTNGEQIALPVGSTALDFVCKAYEERVGKVSTIVVNGIEVEPNYVLQNNDRVEIREDELVNHRNWENYATTDFAKKKIKRLQKLGNNTDN